MPMVALVHPVFDCLMRLAQPDALMNEEEVRKSIYLYLLPVFVRCLLGKPHHTREYIIVSEYIVALMLVLFTLVMVNNTGKKSQKCTNFKLEYI